MDPNGTPTNFLSRLTRLFGDADSEKAANPLGGSGQDEVLDAATIKQRIKRKKRDDAIRKMEFNSLRKILRMRSNSIVTERTVATRPSSLGPISGFSAESRASTLEKIEQAEAQLNAWWNNGANPTDNVELDVDTAKVELNDDMDLDFTAYVEPQPTAPAALDLHAHIKDDKGVPERRLDLPSILEELPAGTVERGLRDAAVFFAEGNSTSAKNLLLAMYQDASEQGEAADALPFALFDVLRYCDDQETFDFLAMDYAQRFGKSPPEWADQKTPLGSQSQHLAAVSSPVADARPSEKPWQCPAVLDRKALWSYVAQGAAAQGASRLHWDALQTLEDDVAELMLEWTEMLVRSPVELHWTGLSALLQAMQTKEQDFANFSKDDRWWRVHMNVLCMANRLEEFENVAIEYCMAMEVSPPSWVAPVCIWVDPAAASPSAEPTTMPAPLTQAPAQSNTSGNAYMLAGDLVGEAARTVAALGELAKSGNLVSVDCTCVGRIDFSAASALLNWVQHCHQRGVDVEFVKLPRLVLIFLQMLGLERYAALVARTR
jgi:ABC-type transporter Mla MlaB component